MNNQANLAKTLDSHIAHIQRVIGYIEEYEGKSHLEQWERDLLMKYQLDLQQLEYEMEKLIKEKAQ